VVYSICGQENAYIAGQMPARILHDFSLCFKSKVLNNIFNEPNELRYEMLRNLVLSL